MTAPAGNRCGSNQIHQGSFGISDVNDDGTEEQKQALRELVSFGFCAAIVNVCNSLQIDGGWLEKLVLDKMLENEMDR